MSMQQIFKDPELNAGFLDKGYAIAGKINPETVAKLRALWQDIKPSEVPGTIYSNVYNMGDIERNLQVDSTIKSIFAPIVESYFQGYYLSGGTFLVKGCGPESSSLPHQDWNNVDEGQHISISIWCPLEDVDAHNGQLLVIPGSHRTFPSVRSTTRPSVFMNFVPELEAHLVPLPMKAGEICFYAHNLFHGSKPNHSETVRVCIVAGLIPEAARHLHYYTGADTPGRAELLAIDEQFYYRDLPLILSGQRPPQLASLGFVDHLPEVLSQEKVMETLNRHKQLAPKQSTGFWARLVDRLHIRKKNHHG